MKLLLPGILLFASLLLGCGSGNDTSPDATQQNTTGTDGQTDPATMAENATTLRHRFTEGQRMDYVETMNSANRILTIGQETSFEMETSFHVIVDAVEEDGSASMTWTTDRLKMKIQGSGGTVRFDSADGEEPDHPDWQRMRGIFFPLQYVEFTFHATTDGIVSDVKLSEAAAARRLRHLRAFVSLPSDCTVSTATVPTAPMPPGRRILPEQQHLPVDCEGSYSSGKLVSPSCTSRSTSTAFVFLQIFAAAALGMQAQRNTS